MKIIKYYLCASAEDDQKEILSAVKMPWSENNEEVAKSEAYKGEYTIEEGEFDYPPISATDERLSELEEALDMLLRGVTE